MRRPGGYLVITDPDAPGGLDLERDTITCSHCQRIVEVKPGTGATVYLIPRLSINGVAQPYHEEMGAFCRLCMKPVCLECHGIGTCTPWEKQMEAIEAKFRFRRQLDGLLR